MAKKFKTAAEKKAVRFGVVLGKNQAKKTGKTSVKSKSSKKAGPKFLGPTFVNGKFYDTNFKKPGLIKTSALKGIMEQYGEGATEKQAVDRYVHHMRRKYGVFDENNRFLQIMGDD